ncbi:hypothetical protein BKA56DRAFT_681884 [Ilyonectria sp. MPI-CAGE-AT-0026]|nr:hypothetical protein BKA56DRAFT_681884 [Ilyonectria sp. MPI-CAGE-AT-0026]
MGGKRKRDTDPSIENRPIWHLRLNAQWPLEIAQCSENHAPQLWTRFKIPSMPLGATPATQSLPLWTLPNELLLQIFEHLSRVDRLFMALTCKRLLSVASMKRPFIPSAKKHRGVEHGCSAMLGILRVTKPTRHGLPDRSWATCCDCYRFRPKKKTYWTNIWIVGAASLQTATSVRSVGV